MAKQPQVWRDKVMARRKLRVKKGEEEVVEETPKKEKKKKKK